MTRERPSASAAMIPDVMPGEGGEPPMHGVGDSGETYDILPDEDYSYGSTEAGSTTGLQGLQLEVDILSADAVDRIAADIAARVSVAASAAGVRAVTVASPDMIAYLRLHAALAAEAAGLEATVDRLAASAPPEAIAVEEAAAFVPALITSAASAVPEVVGRASRVLRNFAATTAYSGRRLRPRQVLLDAALARHLSHRGFAVSVPERAPSAAEPDGLIARILALQARIHQLQQNDRSGADYATVLGSVDALLAAIFGAGEARPAGLPFAQQLALADGVVRTLGEGTALLVAETVFAGGSYRTRRWIFNFLLGRDGLTYNGGAGVTFFLFRTDRWTTLDSDTVYFASAHDRFRAASGDPPRATNISRQGGKPNGGSDG